MGARTALPVVVLALLAAGCGAKEPPEAEPTATATAAVTQAAQTGGEDCAQAGDLDGDPERQPPPDMGVLSYAHLYKSDGGKRFYAVLDGTPDELPSRRDDAQNELVQSWGFASMGTDDEAGVSAGAHLESARRTVDLLVTPLCEGKLQIRYAIK
jgi:hypothetical protein